MLDLDAIEERYQAEADEFAVKFLKTHAIIGDTLGCHEVLALITELRAARDALGRVLACDRKNRCPVCHDVAAAALRRYEAVKDA